MLVVATGNIVYKTEYFSQTSDLIFKSRKCNTTVNVLRLYLNKTPKQRLDSVLQATGDTPGPTSCLIRE